MQNQQLLTNPDNSQSCYNGAEGGFTEQVITTADNNTASNIDAAIMWSFGAYQASVNTSCQCWSWIDTTIDTQLRNGNFDWVTKAQHWYGIGGTTDGAVAPMTIPNSLYLTSKPAFFGTTRGRGSIPSTRNYLYTPGKGAV